MEAFLRNFVWGPVVALVGFVPLLVVNVLQMLSVVLIPLSRSMFRRVNTGFARFVWTLWSRLVEGVNRIPVRLVGDVPPVGENAIVFSNHQSMADIVVLICLARRARMVGYLKWLAKDVVKYVPGVGWGMQFLDAVFLKRNWADDEHNIKQTFSHIVDNRLPAWLVSFPEGTRLTPAKLAAAREFAKTRGITPPQQVMLPRPKGFAASVIGLRDYVTAVYSVTIRYDDHEQSVWGLVSGAMSGVTVDVKRFPIAELPRDEAGIGQWLMAEFLRKDQVMERLGAKGQVL